MAPEMITTVPVNYLRPPAGVQEVGNQGGGNYATAVSPLDWKFFSLKSDAQAVLDFLLAEFPGSQLTLSEDTMEAARFLFAAGNDPQTGPRIYSISGTDKDGNFFYEFAGDILARRIKPDLNPDKSWPYRPGDVLKPNLYVAYGYAEFFWSK